MKVDRIVICEDNLTQAIILIEMLRYHIDNPISHYTQAQQALDVIDTLVEKPVLLIVDLILSGGLSGLDLIHRVHASYPSLPILVTTAAPLRENVTVATGAGAGAFLSKPFSHDELIMALFELNVIFHVSSRE